jgi:predicted ArsR family transcriptional regulator
VGLGTASFVGKRNTNRLIGKRFSGETQVANKKPARRSTIHRVLGEARGRVLTELCAQPQTAVELAERVGTSANAVRVHLESLRDAGLVDYEIVRRGVGKPTHVYSLTAIGEYLTSSAYAPVLQGILDTLRSRMKADFTPLLRDVGASLASRPGSAASQKGLEAAADLLSSFGTPATLKTQAKARVVSNARCPLATITRQTPEVCQLMEALLSAASGIRLRERCERGAHPRCAFAELR